MPMVPITREAKPRNRSGFYGLIGRSMENALRMIEDMKILEGCPCQSIARCNIASGQCICAPRKTLHRAAVVRHPEVKQYRRLAWEN
jgi:hypothetical protein